MVKFTTPKTYKKCTYYKVKTDNEDNCSACVELEKAYIYKKHEEYGWDDVMSLSL